MFEFIEEAWNWRKKRGILKRFPAVRVFHGPGEGRGDARSFSVDRLSDGRQDYYWVTEWGSFPGRQSTRDQLISFYQSQGASLIVGVVRPEKGVAGEVSAWFGQPPSHRVLVREDRCRFWIQLQQTRHSGLFLDHQPLRLWLVQHAQGLRVLNTFAYTGSLSIAALVGGAVQVTSIDLSQSALQWAQENCQANGYDPQAHQWIVGDVLEWLPRLYRQQQRFDCIILDPPSFSHSRQGTFSTLRDTPKLHALAMKLLTHDGILITSVNSAQLSQRKYYADLVRAAETAGGDPPRGFQILQEIQLPETFPSCLGAPYPDPERYLKGYILRSLGRGSSKNRG